VEQIFEYILGCQTADQNDAVVNCESTHTQTHKHMHTHTHTKLEIDKKNGKYHNILPNNALLHVLACLIQVFNM